MYAVGDCNGRALLTHMGKYQARIAADVILGKQIADRPSVQELVHSATVAIAGAVPLDTLRHAVPSFPTIAEVWLHLLEACGL